MENISDKSLSIFQIFMMGCLWIGLSSTLLILSIIILPIQITLFIGEELKGKVLGLLISLSATLSIIISPIIGNMSDRSNSSKFGKRKPYMLLGTFMLCLSVFSMIFTSNSSLKIKNEKDDEVNLILKRCRPYLEKNIKSISVNINHTKSEQHNDQLKFYLFCTSNLMVTVSYILIMVPYNGLIADLIPPNQRGFISGIIGAIILFGNFLGAIIGFFLSDAGLLALYITLCSLILVTSTITLLLTKEPVKLEENFNLIPIGTISSVRSFFNPLRDNDFFWVFITKFSMQMAISTFTGFLEFWLSDMIDIPFSWSIEAAVSFLLLPLLIFAGIFSIVGGYLSDKIKKRKMLVKLSSFIMALCSLSLLAINGKYAYFVAILMIITFGIGYGCFSAVDYAIVMDIVPSKNNTAKDLALWHQATILSQLISNPFGGFILDYFQKKKLYYRIGIHYFIRNNILLLLLKRCFN